MKKTYIAPGIRVIAIHLTRELLIGLSGDAFDDDLHINGEEVENTPTDADTRKRDWGWGKGLWEDITPQ